MLYLAINSVERTSGLIAGSLAITNQIQQRADSCNFELMDGTPKPSENQDARIFVYDTIASFVGATVVLNGYFERNIVQFFTGQTLWIRIGDADEEKVTVQSYNETTLTIVLSAAPSGSVVAGDKVGILIFGGVVSRVADKNIHSLSNLEYDVECVDYTKIFDRKLIADTWTDVDSRYIINDFCNTTVNYNSTIDNMSYANDAAIQAEWIESNDGTNPTVDAADFMEALNSGILGWTFAGGTATFSATPTSQNISSFTGAASGTPVRGFIMCWIKPSDYTKITTIKIRIGSDASNYAELTLPALTDNNWAYLSADLDSATMVGNPDWTAVDYLAVIVTETATSSIRINGIRINAQNSFTLYNVESTPSFDDLRAAQLKPTGFMQTLAKTWNYIWYVDYERDIHFVDSESVSAPFALTNSSNNFWDLQTEVDQSQLGNRIIIRGGEKQSTSYYAEIHQGDNAKREWVLKTKFADLSVLIDNNTTTHAAEVGTTTTNIKITGHGLVTGDHIINRTRSNAVRVITYVDVDNFTVETVASQTNGDTISYFALSKLVGIEGIVDESTVNYVYNSNSQSVRSSNTFGGAPGEATLTTTSFIRFKYKERVNIQFQYTDSASATTLKALGFGDGIFDLDPYTDKNIDNLGTALAIAQAKVTEYSNPIITGRFMTTQFGLAAGQIISITDTVRNIVVEYVIQKINKRQVSGQYNDYFEYRIDFGTTLFGIIEFFQKLLATQDRIEQNIDQVVETYVSADETVTSDDVNAVAKDGGFKSAKIAETVTSDDVNTVTKINSGTWQYEPSVGQAIPTRFDMADYG